MKVIRNRVIPFRGFKCVNLFGVLFVREGAALTDKDINHEAIHTAQMKELAYLFYYPAYFFEWLYRLVRYPAEAYRGISFEREAYLHEGESDYLVTRKHYAQWRSEE